MEEIYYSFNPWWEKKDFESGISREEYLQKLSPLFKRKQIEILIGSRRAGKTTILKQLIKKIISRGVSAQKIFYLSLDHPRISAITISDHLKTFRQLFMHSRKEKLWLFFDEVQESPNWEMELKALYDLENVKIICTGSTSALVKSQGGRLTGRQIVTTIYPLSFNEVLVFKKKKVSYSETYQYEKLTENYLQSGGYPEQVMKSSDEYLTNLLEDIIARDLVRLFNIQKPALLKDLLRLLTSAVGSRSSYNKLANVLKVSVDTIKDYIGYFDAAFLVKSIEKWSTSYTDRVYSTKKIYLLDTGIKTLLTGKGDLGMKAENAVLIQLLRENEKPAYWAESEREVDFIIGSFTDPLPIEVKYLKEKFDWQDKKFAGLKLFFHRFPQTKKALIITKNIAKEFKENNKTITVIPLWKFLHEYPKN